MTRQAVVVAVIAGILLLTGSGLAYGKGPESVTFTGPGIDSPIELTDQVSRPISCDTTCPADPMVRLMEQSGLWYATGDLPTAIDPPTSELGPRHELTWVRLGAANEPLEERTIRQFIYLDANNGPLIHTVEQEGLKGWGPGVTGWFKAPAGIVNTLSALGAPLSHNDTSPTSNRTPSDHLGLLALMSLALALVVRAARHRSLPAK